MMAVLCTQRHESCTGNKKSELSIRCWHNLEATVQLHHVWGDTTFTGHLWSGGSWELCAVLSCKSRRSWVRRIEVHSVDLGHAGCQVTEEASPHLCVHPFTRGQETSDLSYTLTEPSSVFTKDGWVCVHSSCRGKYKKINTKNNWLI